MAAEIFGKASGLYGAKGGHTYLFEADNNFSCSGIVGASLQQAAGTTDGDEAVTTYGDWLTAFEAYRGQVVAEGRPVDAHPFRPGPAVPVREIQEPRRRGRGGRRRHGR